MKLKIISRHHLWEKIISVIKNDRFEKNRTWLESLLLFIATTIPVFILFNPSFKEIFKGWSTAHFSFAPLIIATSVYLVWTKREQVKTITPIPEYNAFIAIFFCIIVWYGCKINNFSSLQNYIALTVIILSVWAAFGDAFIKCNLFPLMFLYFAVPFDPFFNNILMKICLDSAYQLMQSLSMEVMKENFIIVYKGIKVAIVPSGSGFRSIHSILIFATLLGYFLLQDITKRILLVLVAGSIALVMNIVRVCVLTVLFSMGYTSNFMITVVGIIVFILDFTLLFLIARYWKKKETVTDSKGEKKFDIKNNSKNIVLIITIATLISGAHTWIQKKDNIYQAEYQNRDPIRFYQEIMALDTHRSGGLHPEIVLEWNTIGFVCMANRQYEKAIFYFEKARDMNITIFGEKHKNVALSWFNLGMVFNELDDPPKARYHYQKALNIILESYGRDHVLCRQLETIIKNSAGV